MKNKTAAVWLAFLGGPFGLHRWYIKGRPDRWAWLYPIPTALGGYGLLRARSLGLDDALSWVLIPALGLVFACTALQAIVYGLMPPERWNARFNPQASAQDPSGATHWGTVFALALALMLGTGVLMATLAFGFQGYFEHELQEARKISQ